MSTEALARLDEIATRAVLGLRPDWDVPGFVLARRARPERG